MGYKFVVGLIKFYITFAIFGMFANIITYASADMLYFVIHKQSFLRTIIFESETLTEEFAFSAVKYFMETAMNSIPGNILFEETIGIAIDGADGNILGFMESIEDIAAIGGEFKTAFSDYAPYFMRDMAVATLASFVIFIVVDLKDKLIKVRAGFSVFLGFSFSLFFWILAGYTFGNCLITALELFINSENKNILYIVVIVFAIAFEGIVHSYAKKCPLSRLLVLAVIKIVFNVIKALLAWLMFLNVTDYYSLSTIPALVILSILFTVLSAVELNASNWADGGISLITTKRAKKGALILKSK